jgi:hypothetical protein
MTIAKHETKTANTGGTTIIAESNGSPPFSRAAPPCSRLVLQCRYIQSHGIPKPWTEWHDHPEPHQIAWGPGQYATLEENMKAACEGYYAIGQGCEFRMVRRTDETLWEYSANKNTHP